MRATRELPVAASLVLVGFALFFGGGPGNGSIPWVGGGALLAILILLATRGVPGGWALIAPLVALAAWCALSIWWSWLPDRSWDYANRTLVYALLAAVGLWAAQRTRALAAGLAVLLATVIVWSLLGKVLPGLYDYGPPYVARIRGPIGLWNQLALAADFAIVFALWRRRRSGTLLAYVACVALLLTYSRGGILTALVLAAAWFALGEERLESAATLVAAVVPAAAVAGLAFALPGVTSDLQPLHTRWRDGLVFGAALLAGAGAALALERLPRPRDTPALRRGALAVAAVLVAGAVAFVALRGIGSGAVSNTSGHLTSTSSNFRFTWWGQAWRGFEHHPLTGTGAGSFHLVNLRYRSTYLDETTEPHDLPLQFLSELGVVGLALLVPAIALLLRPGLRRRGHELALALVLPAYLLHSLVDVDWDFLAVSAPAFVAAGALAGRPAARRLSVFGLLPAAGVALLAFGALLMPWLGNRWANEALGAPPARAVELADRARAVDPLLVEPLWAKAYAAADLGRSQVAFDWFDQAVRRQPQNPETWVAAGRYALDQNCPYLAWTYLERYTELDQKARKSAGGADYERALKRVNERDYRC